MKAQHSKIDITYLKRGDRQILSKTLGVSKNTISLVICGANKSARIKRGVIRLNEERRLLEETALQKMCDSIKEEAITDFK